MRLLVCSKETDSHPQRKAGLGPVVHGDCFYVRAVRPGRDGARLQNEVSGGLRAAEADILNWQSFDLKR